MQAWKITLAIALVAAIPMVPGVNAADCASAPAQEEDLVHPLNKDTFIVVKSTENFGFWTNTNGRDHLQTRACEIDGVERYPADQREGGLILG